MSKKIFVIIITILFLGCLPNSKKNRRDFDSKVVFALGSDVQLSGYSQKESLFDGETTWVSDEAVLTNDDIKEMFFSEEEATGQDILNIYLNEEATELFSEFTEENINKKLCIVSNDYILVNAVIYSKIPGGKIRVTGAFTQEKIDKLLGHTKSE